MILRNEHRLQTLLSRRVKVVIKLAQNVPVFAHFTSNYSGFEFFPYASKIIGTPRSAGGGSMNRPEIPVAFPHPRTPRACAVQDLGSREMRDARWGTRDARCEMRGQRSESRNQR